MSNKTIIETQSWLKQLGYDPGKVDGVWGSNSSNALARLLSSQLDVKKIYGVKSVTWGKKFTEPELAKMIQVIDRLGLKKTMVQDFMSCIAWESGETFSPSVKSPVSSAIGLVQFIESTAKGLGTTTKTLSQMTVIQQLEYVYNYFKPYAGKLNNLGDVYMTILWPKGIGKDDKWVLWDSENSPATYKANKGLDLNKTGRITRADCLHKINNKMVKGFLPEFARTF